MLSSEQIEDALPCPIRIEICCDQDWFCVAVRDSFKKLLIKHNKKYETKIEHIIRHYIDSEEDILEHNECRIFVGEEAVHFMKGPDLLEDDSQLSQEYYKSIVNITEGILSTWHDKIIEIQNKNEIKLEQYKEEGYDEMLYGYYIIRCDNRAFQYLKKLATRYPNSKYMNKLCRVYRTGRPGWHRRNISMTKKIGKRRDRHDDF